MNNPVTYDIADFGRREIAETGKLLTAYAEGQDKGNCLDRFGEGVKVGFNRNSGYVWLEDEDYNTLMYDEDTDSLFQWYFLSYAGEEGSAEDLYNEFLEDAINPKDLEQLADILEDEGMEKEAAEVRAKMEEEE